MSTTAKVTSRTRGRVNAECPLCAANGREPNDQSLLALEEVERGEVYEYTAAVGPGMIDRILNGEPVAKKAMERLEDPP